MQFLFVHCVSRVQILLLCRLSRSRYVGVLYCAERLSVADLWRPWGLSFVDFGAN